MGMCVCLCASLCACIICVRTRVCVCVFKYVYTRTFACVCVCATQYTTPSSRRAEFFFLFFHFFFPPKNYNMFLRALLARSSGCGGGRSGPHPPSRPSCPHLRTANGGIREDRPTAAAAAAATLLQSVLARRTRLSVHRARFYQIVPPPRFYVFYAHA